MTSASTMTSSRDTSVDELRQKSERSRAELAGTITELRENVAETTDELKTRLSPAHIKEEVKGYVREGSVQLFSSIERKARENPLQAVAIGAGLAYPLWGILKTIPVPIMLVGTGLWLSRQKAGRDSTPRNIVDKISEAGTAGACEIAVSVRDAKASLVASAEAATARISASTQDIRDSVADMSDTLKSRAADAADSVSATASDLRDTGVQYANQSRNALGDLAHQNPLLVAGIGLAIGAFIAASLPASDTENRLFGKRSDEVKDEALQVASQGLDRAKDVAAGVVEDVAGASDREGLNAKSMAEAVEGITEGVKTVVDKGLKTALGEVTAPLPTYDSP